MSKLYQISLKFNSDQLIESNSQIGLIPLKNDGLVLYAKFDQETGFNYIKPNNTTIQIRQTTKLVDYFDGPFSSPNSSYSSTASDNWLEYFKMSPKIDLSSFTLAFYFRVTGNEIVGVFYDLAPPVNLDLELHIHNSTAESPDSRNTVSSFTFRNVFKPNDWQFVALTYDAASKIAKLYDQTATVKQEQAYVEIDQVLTGRLGVAEGIRFRQWTTISPSSAIACLSVYGRVLSPITIALLPCADQLQ